MSTVFIILGVLVLLVVVAIIAVNVGRKKTATVNINFDEQFVVDNLGNSDIKEWYKINNSEKKWVNILFRPNEENMKKYGCKVVIPEHEGEAIIQCVFDEDTNNIISGRIVIYNSMNKKLESIINSNNGVVIFD